MAQVDFSNARIEPVVSPNVSTGNATANSYLNLNSTALVDATDNAIVTNYSSQLLKNEKKEFVYMYTGTFTTSGTVCYIRYVSNVSWWKISNISFSAGDTYAFSIKADLICQ